MNAIDINGYSNLFNAIDFSKSKKIYIIKKKIIEHVSSKEKLKSSRETLTLDNSLSQILTLSLSGLTAIVKLAHKMYVRYNFDVHACYDEQSFVNVPVAKSR